MTFEFSPTKSRRKQALRRRNITLLQLKLGRKVSGDSPLSLLKRKKEAKRKEFAYPCTVWQCTTRRLHTNKTPPAGQTGGCCRRNITLFTVEIGA
ncbi:MAG: hypothetical protein ACLSFT_08285 [Ruminococcus callidus]